MDIISSIYVARLFAAVATGHFAKAARLNAHVALIRSSSPPRLGPARTHPEVLMALPAAEPARCAGSLLASRDLNPGL